MMAKAPSPALRAPSPTRGEGDSPVAPSTLPSPLVGEGGDARSALTGEGAAGRTLRLAKHLRKNMTEAETKLWHQLRAKRFESYKFKRQAPIGKYIADFASFTHRLVVEVDGSQHEGSASDIVRDAWLKSQGFKVLRFWNRELLLDVDGAMMSILAALQETPLPPFGHPLPQGERAKKVRSKP
jgi:very-short-patch-repair endonuclease